MSALRRAQAGKGIYADPSREDVAVRGLQEEIMRAQRRDLTEIGIVEALELMGYTVERMYTPCPYDLSVSRPASSPLKLPMECKSPGGKVSYEQAEYFADYPDLIVYSPDEAVRAADKYL